MSTIKCINGKEEKKRGFLWISLYFAANLLLTIHNKWVMSKSGFDFPWILTAIHISVSGIGSYFLDSFNTTILRRNSLRQVIVWMWTKEGTLRLLAFSSLYALNIAMSNLSLSFVSLALHQIIRSSTPIFTVIFDLTIRGKRTERREIISLVPVVIGITMATLRPEKPSNYIKIDVFYMYGLSLTIFGVALSAIKGIATNLMLSGPSCYSPLELIWKTAILSSIQCLLIGYFRGEIDGIRVRFSNIENPWGLGCHILMNGILAFLLNWVSFTANSKTSALSMTVAGNVKQALIILLAIYIFNTKISPVNSIGIGITLFGGIWYSYLKYQKSLEKNKGLLKSINNSNN